MEDRKDLKAWFEYNDGIIHLKHFPGAVIDIHDIKNIIAFQKELAGGSVFSLLVDMRQGARLNESASALIANNPLATQIKRVAIVVDEGFAYNKVSEFIMVAQPNAKTHVFVDMEAARKWLEG